MMNLNEYRILFVDDDRNLLDNFNLQFGRRYSVSVADSVEAARTTLSNIGEVDVLVSDLRMPGRSGLDLLSWAKGRYPDTIRILLTGHADVETAVRAVNSANVFRLLTKPCPREMLDEALSEACFMREFLLTQKAIQSRKARDVTIESVVHSLSYLVERWDAYTAGHQKKVAELGMAIGRELGLEDEELHLLELAASIHDLGKVLVPLGFLNKTGKLNAMEMGIIREHPENGYRMLCQIECMRDVAEIVGQHHERINGSGYPLGLMGEDIRLEARIIAVADTVEAMSSHRPYRPSLGLDAALDELRLNRGTLYDSQVVDAACRALSCRTGNDLMCAGNIKMAL